MDTKNITEILGYERVINEIFLEVLVSKFVVFRGPSGSGKTKTIFKELKRKFSESEYRTIYTNADECQQVSSLYIFEHLLDIRKSSKKQSMGLRKGIGRIVDGLSPVKFLSGLLDIVSTETVESELMLDENFSEKEVSILILLNDLCLSQKCILVIDHFAWLDKSSVKLLNYIFSSAQHKHLSALSELVVIAIVTNEHLISDNATNIGEIDLNCASIDNAVTIELPSVDKVEKLLNNFGCELKLTKKEIDIIYQLSKGHLEILSIIANLLKKTPNLSNIVTGRIDRQLHKLYQLSFGYSNKQIFPGLLQKLGKLSMLGDKFARKQINCLLNSEGDSFADSELKLVLDAGIIIKQDTLNYSFSHEFHKNSFASFVVENTQKIHKQVAECLKGLLPSNYRLRSFHLFKARLFEEASTMLLHGMIQLLSNKQRPFEHINKSERILLAKHETKVLFNKFSNAYEFFHKNNFDAVIIELEGMGVDIPYTLMAERDYLIALSNIEQHNKNLFKNAKELVSKWNNLQEEGELELWAKISLLKIQSMVLIGEINNAKLEELSFSQKLQSLKTIDPKLTEYLHVQNRKATAIKISEIAERNIKVALDFFSSNYSIQFSPNIFETYKTLVNYIAVLINRGKYQDAFDYSEQCFAFMNNYRDISFVRRDILANNYVVSSVRCNRMSFEEACNSQLKIMNSVYCTRDNHIHWSNYIALLIMSGKLREAEIQIKILEKDIAKNLIDEGYILYNYFNNVMAFYLISNNKELFEDFYEKTMSVVKCHEWPAIPLIKKRLDYIHSKKNFLLGRSYKELNFDVLNSDNSSAWLFYGSPVTLCELQFWATS